MPMVVARSGPSKAPSGPTALELAMAVRTCSIDTPMAASAGRVDAHADRRLLGAGDGDVGDAVDLAAGAGRSRCRRRRKARCRAWSSRSAPGSGSARAAGLALRNAGSVGMSPGRSVSAALSAACTSRAAPSMLRDRSNCTAMRVLPSELSEVISVTPAMAPSWRSSGAATVAAIVSGAAPGRLAEMKMVGNSTLGRLATGRKCRPRRRPGTARSRAVWCRSAGG